MNYQMWVGNQFYSRDSYLKEAKKMGASKKIGWIPHDLVLGQSKIYIISDMSEQEREKYQEELKKRHSMAYFRKKETGTKSLKGFGVMPRGQPLIFGYFIANAIIQTTQVDVVVSEVGDIPRKLYVLKDGGFGTMDERGCGSLKPKSLYVISETSMNKIIELYNNPDKFSENVVVFDTPIPYTGKRFRGIQETTDNF